MEWVLIVMLTAMTSNGGVAVHHVPGFKTENACQLAGLKVQREARSVSKEPVPVFACVER